MDCLDSRMMLYSGIEAEIDVFAGSLCFGFAMIPKVFKEKLFRSPV